MPIYKKSKDAAAYLWVNGTKHPYERPSIHLRFVDGNWLWEPLFESHLCNIHVDAVQKAMLACPNKGFCFSVAAINL
jgi:hypothetical protein